MWCIIDGTARLRSHGCEVRGCIASQRHTLAFGLLGSPVSMAVTAGCMAEKWERSSSQEQGCGQHPRTRWGTLDPLAFWTTPEMAPWLRARILAIASRSHLPLISVSAPSAFAACCLGWRRPKRLGANIANPWRAVSSFVYLGQARRLRAGSTHYYCYGVTYRTSAKKVANPRHRADHVCVPRKANCRLPFPFLPLTR
jgi:hypothetical protein